VSVVDASGDVDDLEARRAAGGKFLDAYARCERYLRRVVDAERGVPFGHLVREAARHDRTVRRFRDDLLEYAELRNAIVHQRVDGRPIADPHPKVAAEFERIANLLDRPPLLTEQFGRKVATTTASASLETSLQLMRGGDYSSLPVYEGRTFIGVLTSSTIARWLAAAASSGSVDLSVPTRDVLAHAKHAEDRVKFVSHQASVIDALELFQQAADRGVKLDAIILTEHGGQGEAPLGIVTPADLPEILDQLDEGSRSAPTLG
jgi:CBS domain-containing protein